MENPEEAVIINSLVRQKKYVTVVVVSDSPTERNWIITAYITRRLINGEIEWQKS